MAGLQLCVSPQTVLYEKRIVDGGENREEEGGAQKGLARNIDPYHRHHQQQQSKEDRRHLSQSVRFAEDAGTKVFQAGDHEEHSTDQQNRDIAAEDHNRELPWHERSVLNGEHQEHGAHEQLVGDGVEILSELRLLMESASQQAIETVADSGQDKQHQRPHVMVADDIDDDEWQESHP